MSSVSSTSTTKRWKHVRYEIDRHREREKLIDALREIGDQSTESLKENLRKVRSVEKKEERKANTDAEDH